MQKRITAKQTKHLFSLNQEISLIDVREIGLHASGHPFYSISIPYSIFEAKIQELVPNKSVLIILFDHNDGLSEIVYEEVKNIGYNNVRILENGVFGWKKEGYELFDGINIPSKAFGEWVEEEYKTPHIKPRELAKKIKSNKNILVLDGRTIEEFRTMNIPTAINCPNMEIPVRIIDEIDSHTEIIIGCAGRTRSIIGTQNLINYGIKNSVKALENGTQGWFLANLKLQHNQNKRLSLSKLKKKKLFEEKSRYLIKKFNLKTINFNKTKIFLEGKNSTTYVFNVTEPKKNLSIFPNIRNVPGGQLIQATDNFIAVWNSKIVLLDDGELIRSTMTASWLKQMGYEVYLYNDKPEKLDKYFENKNINFKLMKIKNIKLNDLKKYAKFTMLDVRNSHNYRKLHLKKSKWTTRSNLRFINLVKDKDILIIYDEPKKAQLITKSINTILNVNVFYHFFDKKGYLTYPDLYTQTPYNPKTSDCIDFVYHTHKRHKGNISHAKAYLSWEKKLLSRMDDQEFSRFTKL